MSAHLSPQPESSLNRPWYLKWWVWLITAVVFVGFIGAVVVGGVNAVLQARGGSNALATPEAASPVVPEPTAPEAPAEADPPDLAAFLTRSGVSFESASISARKAIIYVPTTTTNEQARQIASDTMLYICDHPTRAGDNFANRVEVSDSVSIYSPGYDAADHPRGFATEDIC